MRLDLTKVLYFFSLNSHYHAANVYGLHNMRLDLCWSSLILIRVARKFPNVHKSYCWISIVNQSLQVVMVELSPRLDNWPPNQTSLENSHCRKRWSIVSFFNIAQSQRTYMWNSLNPFRVAHSAHEYHFGKFSRQQDYLHWKLQFPKFSPEIGRKSCSLWAKESTSNLTAALYG